MLGSIMVFIFELFFEDRKISFGKENLIKGKCSLKLKKLTFLSNLIKKER